MNEISYQLKWDEGLYWAYRQFKLQLLRRASPIRRYDLWRRVGLFAGGLVICVLIVSIRSGNSEGLANMILGFGLGYWIYYGYLVYRNREFAEEEFEQAASAPEVDIVIDPSGIRMVTETNECRISWGGCSSVETFSGGLVLWDEREQSAILIPDCALPSGSDRDSVRKQVEAWRSAAS